RPGRVRSRSDLERRMGEEPAGCGAGTRETSSRSRTVPNLRSLLSRTMAGAESGPHAPRRRGPRLSGQASHRTLAQKGGCEAGTRSVVRPLRPVRLAREVGLFNSRSATDNGPNRFSTDNGPLATNNSAMTDPRFKKLAGLLTGYSTTL